MRSKRIGRDQRDASFERAHGILNAEQLAIVDKAREAAGVRDGVIVDASYWLGVDAARAERLELARLWCQWNGQKGTPAQAEAVADRLRPADLARMLGARGALPSWACGSCGGRLPVAGVPCGCGK